MKNKKNIWIIMSAVVLSLVFISIKGFGPVLHPSAEMLSSSEAKALVEDRYKGQVTEIGQKSNQYIIEMDRKNINYELILDAEDGEVISFIKKGMTKNVTEKTETKPSASKTLTENEIKQKIQSEFKGELLVFVKINVHGKSQYKAVIKEDGIKTILKVDAQTGEILFHKTEKEVKVIVTENEASQIALNQVKGQIDDVDLEIDDELNYYLVDIETADEREATVQIHAITGEVLSITWDN